MRPDRVFRFSDSVARALHALRSTYSCASDAESRLRCAYFANQARIRAAIAIPVCLGFFLAYLQPGLAGDPRRTTVLVGSLLIAIYAFLTAFLARRASHINIRAHVATIILDNSAITACVGVTESAGEVLVWLFLFITLGNGFRFGPAFLHTCQLFSLAGLTVIFLFSDHWSNNPHQWLGAVLTMLVVPAYANGLLHKLQAAIRTAEDASKAKSHFLARMSHELRTPLNGMIAAADLLKDSPLLPDQQQLLNIVRQGGRILLDEIRDVLDISKIEANQVTLEFAPLVPAEIVDAVHTVLSQAASAKRLLFRSVCDESATALVQGDPYHLRQIIMNLAGNAIKFTESGSVTIGVQTLARTPSTVRLGFSVEDTGVGIPRDKLSRIFEPFRQADESTTRRFGGTGLGLSIARQLVRLMGGEISVDSTVNEGTRFSFALEFPLIAETGSEPATTACAANQYAGIDHAHAALSPLRILVADDNATNREVLALMLKRDDHCVSLANDGADALQQLTTSEFDLAILDHNMPALSGLDALRMYRSASEAPIPIIIASADATPEAIVESRSAGAVAHICKPITLDQLRSVIAAYAPPSESNLASVTRPSKASIPRLVVPEKQPHVVDENILEQRARLSPDPTFAEQLVEGYIRDVELLTEEIHAALDTQDIGRLKDAAHALKGGSATIGASGLYEFSKRLQDFDESYLAGDTLTALIELNELVKLTTVALRSFVAKRSVHIEALST